MTSGERIRHLEVEGYVVVPDLLSPTEIAHLKSLVAPMETKGTDYSDKQRGRHNIHWDHPDLANLIAHPPTLRFLEHVMGDDIIFHGAVYGLSMPGHPGISMHTDGQPYGSQIFGFAGSCPVQIRVLYYLDDLTEDV